MHPEARRFLEYVRATLGEEYYHGKVLDVGSGDINGNNRQYFDPAKTEYVGCDVAEGPNVTIVSPCHLLPFPDAHFDVVISSECFEHDMHYVESLGAIYRMLRPRGLFVFTCASLGRPEHGTLRTTPQDSFTAKHCSEKNADWANYYKNLTPSDVAHAWATSLKDKVTGPLFEYADFYYNAFSHDLYFVGVKKDSAAAPFVPPVPYTGPGVLRVIPY